jgi:hypothetical protein
MESHIESIKSFRNYPMKYQRKEVWIHDK